MILKSGILRKPSSWCAIVIAGTLLLAYLSLIKAPNIRIGPDTENRVMHFLAYTTYSLSIFFWRYLLRRDIPIFRNFIEAFLISATYGVMLEAFQNFFPNRDPDIFDALANIFGSLSGPGLASSLSRKLFL